MNVSLQASQATGESPAGTRSGVCYLCSLRCPTRVHVSGGRATRIEMADAASAACPRWPAQLDFIYHPDRLLHPARRTGERGGSSFERISWDEALDAVAGGLQKVKDEYGPEAVVFWIAYTKEPRPYFHRLAHGFGSPNYCTESSSCFSAAWLAANLTYGPDYGALAAQSGQADPATRCQLVWGNSIKNSALKAWPAHLAARQRGVKLIVVDPRRTEIAALADIHLQPRPGTDGALALGMMHVIIGEGLYDKDFVAGWTVGFDGLQELVREYPPERAAVITGVPAAGIMAAARLYATVKPAKILLSSNSTTHHANGVQNHRAIILLTALTGNIEVAGGNRAVPYSQRDKSINDITLHDRLADMPPGVGSQRFPIWTQRYAEMQSNAIAGQIESGRPYPIKAIFSSGLNAQFFPDSNRMTASLKTLDFIGVTEYFLTPGARLADVVLPIASWLERPILMDCEGRVRLVEPAIAPVGESRTEWDIYAALAERLGFGDLFWGGDFTRCVDYILEPLGITCKDLRQHPEGIERPASPKAERAYEQTGFQTPSGKVEIACGTLAEHGHDPLPAYREPPESPASRPDLAVEFPLVLTSGARVPAYIHSQLRNIERLRRLMPEPLVEINPADAAPRGIREGDSVTITSPRGRIRMKASVTDTILPGVVSLPHHWPGEANVNSLVDSHTLDPISGFPPFKSQLCQVARENPRER